MKKSIFSIFMAIIICLMTVSAIYAHAFEDNLPMSTSTCPACGNRTLNSACGGSVIDSYTTACNYISGCTIVFRLFTTVSRCSSCGYVPGGYSPETAHTHITHTVCSYSSPCPFDTSLASIGAKG